MRPLARLTLEARGVFSGGHDLAYPLSNSSAIARSANGRSLSSRLCCLRGRFSLGDRAYAGQQPRGPGRHHRRTVDRSGVCRSGRLDGAGSGRSNPCGADRRSAGNDSSAESRRTESRRSGAGSGTEGAGGRGADRNCTDRGAGSGSSTGTDCNSSSGCSSSGCTSTGSNGRVDIDGGNDGGAGRSIGSGGGDGHHGNASSCRGTEEAGPQEGGAEAAAPELLRFLLRPVLGQSVLRQPQSVRPGQ